METHTPQPTTTAIHPATQVGLVAIAVADLERSVTFYRDALGFALLERSSDTATLGAGDTPLLRLQQEHGAQPWPQDRQSYTGLYHFAILVPTRVDLGLWLQHWLDLGFPVPGQGDHLVSEALYLSDPDGNGIEIYRDRPRTEWLWAGNSVQMGVDPVDLPGVLADATNSGREWAGMAPGTRLGHVHLQVGDIPTAAAFYHDILGFDITASMPSALFVSAGGYHHHIGMNIWHSRGATHAPPGFAGLRLFTITFADAAARADVVARVRGANLDASEDAGIVTIHDPWHNTILLVVESLAGATDTPAILETAR